MKNAGVTALLVLLSTLVNAEVRLGTREVLLDNDAVQVVRLTYPVGTESGVHGHAFPNRAVYFIKGGKLELIPADGQEPATVVETHDGEVFFVPATTHNVRNVGDSDVVIIETEIK